ncbi:MAG: NAD(P)/FAD-dependent oxidoreductase [Halolamina sp.]|uniref:flavin monoamine oxidase family protein n=1 Tax=Halolamina sp. TaxID=1940283 RepID=UPI002FC34046
MTDQRDAVIVGGGLAGLTAGRGLLDHGLDAVVVEARDRVGGKTASEHTADGDVVELGGQWVGADQTRIRSLVEEFGIDTRPQYDNGAVVGRLGDERWVAESYDELLRSISDKAETELFAAFDEIERCVEQVPRETPQAAPAAERWDETTLQSWIDDWFDTPEATAAFERMIPGIYTAEPGELSFLFFCYYARTAGGFDMVAGLNHDSDSHAEVVVDVQSIAKSLGEELGEALRLNRPVRRIEQDDDGVTVRTPEQDYRADYAVVALPPTLAGRLSYDPPLPPGRDELSQRMPNGAVVKCLLGYEAPFWRAGGYSGFAEDNAGPAHYYFDDGEPDGETGRLVGFICGDAARQWASRDREARRAALTEQLVSLFEDERLAAPVNYLDRAWTGEMYSRGAYHGYPTPGTITACWEHIRQPVGRIHWAGAETATEWYGHMDGAVRSGERAAAEIRRRTE